MKAFYLIVGAVLTFIGLVVGFTFATKVDTAAQAKWWDLMTAFGTVGATCAAVYFGLQAAIKSRRTEIAQAKLAAWSLSTPLAELCVLAETLAEEWRKEPDRLKQHDLQRQDKDRLRAVRGAFAPSTLVPIAIVEQDCAKVIAEGLAKLDTVIAALAFDTRPIDPAEPMAEELDVVVKELTNGATMLASLDKLE